MLEVTSGALLKRMAFALLSGEVDQYVKYLPDIQGITNHYELQSPCDCLHVFEK